MKGVQFGYYWTVPLQDGIYIEISNSGYSVDFRRVKDGVMNTEGRPQIAILKDVYDQNNGCNVAGIELTDVNGNPTGETYKLRDFKLSGNVSLY